MSHKFAAIDLAALVGPSFSVVKAVTVCGSLYMARHCAIVRISLTVLGVFPTACAKAIIAYFTSVGRHMARRIVVSQLERLSRSTLSPK